MIHVDGEKVVLGGNDAVLTAELALLLSMIRSRLNSKGYDDAGAYATVIDPALGNAKLYTTQYLKSVAKMTADQEKYEKMMNSRRKTG